MTEIASTPAAAPEVIPPGIGKASLFKKMAAVLGDVQRVPKNGRNQFFKYDYATEADLVDVLRPALSKHGVAIFVNVAEVETRPNDITRTTLDITFGCGDTGETWTVRWYGDGQDKVDKGLYKAYTGALKYALMKTFLVSTGDDPEDDTAEAKPAANGNGRAAQQTPVQQAAQHQQQVNQQRAQQAAAAPAQQQAAQSQAAQPSQQPAQQQVQQPQDDAAKWAAAVERGEHKRAIANATGGRFHIRITREQGQEVLAEAAKQINTHLRKLLGPAVKNDAKGQPVIPDLIVPYWTVVFGMAVEQGIDPNTLPRMNPQGQWDIQVNALRNLYSMLKTKPTGELEEEPF